MHLRAVGDPETEIDVGQPHTLGCLNMIQEHESAQAAPVFIASGAMSSVADLIGASRRTNRLIRTTFAVSLAYNVIAVCLAILGFINPLVAAILMPISSVSVLSLTLAWPTFAAETS